MVARSNTLSACFEDKAVTPSPFIHHLPSSNNNDGGESMLSLGKHSKYQDSRLQGSMIMKSSSRPSYKCEGRGPMTKVGPNAATLFSLP